MVTGDVAEAVSLSERGVEPQAVSHEIPLAKAKPEMRKRRAHGDEMIRLYITSQYIKPYAHWHFCGLVELRCSE